MQQWASSELCCLFWHAQDGAGSENAEALQNGAAAAEKAARTLTGRCWMAEGFPMSLAQLLPLLDVVGAANKHLARVGRFLQKYGELDLFPVKLQARAPAAATAAAAKNLPWLSACLAAIQPPWYRLCFSCIQKTPSSLVKCYSACHICELRWGLSAMFVQGGCMHRLVPHNWLPSACRNSEWAFGIEQGACMCAQVPLLWTVYALVSFRGFRPLPSEGDASLPAFYEAPAGYTRKALHESLSKDKKGPSGGGTPSGAPLGDFEDEDFY
jgi:hypothetical protein